MPVGHTGRHIKKALGYVSDVQKRDSGWKYVGIETDVECVCGGD